MDDKIKQAILNAHKLQEEVSNLSASFEPSSVISTQDNVENSLSEIRSLKKRANLDQRELLEVAEQQLLNSQKDVLRNQSIYNPS
ncbi:hypothetical protein SAMN00017405_1966 [Desulfonispora thiosulfatigenes DSM 11270]|uniref:Uncharacterized protein n=1 Tax=Desulfonispora thiosulfatigenes DSM 11270 TaxID=656914 RepID=A0A1W1VGI3_DESTI|nr:hypothetical protein [Desulfonispora thiosulfatigenes]SMB92487.1 hypothetical protein SAMN00017405_1966 [Desulfonispora thiosulfatigenes DSM 11270]